MLRCAVPTTLVLAALIAPSAHAAGDPTMPLDQVRPGMACVAKSVVRGTEVATFDARIDDVIRDGRDLRRARLLVTVSGAAIDATGVGAGFSGSPVICPGSDGTARIAGAISETIGAYGGKTVLATPIQAVLGEPVDPPRQTASAAHGAALLSRARPLATPISVGGLSPALGGVLQRAARRAGRTLFLSPSAEAASPQTPAPLVPGSAIAMGYATGDITAGAIGTVSYVDGDAVWALGHPLDGAGRRDLFLQSAYVFGVIDNPVASDDSATYKLAAPMDAIGTLRQDGLSAVVGRLGAAPAGYPLRVTARDKDAGRLRAILAQLVDERAVGFPVGYSALSALAAPAAVEALQEVLSGSPVRQSSDMCIRISVKQRRKPLAFCNRYVGGGGDAEALAAGRLASDVGAAAVLIDDFDAAKLEVKGVEIGMRVRRGLALGTLVSVTGPRVVARGSTLTLRARVRKPGGPIVIRKIRVRVPRFMPQGERDLLLKGSEADAQPGDDGADLDLSSLFAGGPGGADGDTPPSSVKALAERISDLHRYDGVSARFVPPGAGAPEQLPGGAERFAQRSRRVFRDDRLRIAGRARWRVFVF